MIRPTAGSVALPAVGLYGVTLIRIPFAPPLLFEPARGVTRTEVTDGTGRVRLLNGHKAASENTLELEVHALRPGLYLLYVQTERGQRVLRFVKEQGSEE